MTDFPYHDRSTAPAAAKPLLEQAEKAYGMLPNLLAKMAEAPALLEGYWTLTAVFGNSSLSAAEQQVVLITTSRSNECTYCVGVHSALADMQKVPTEVTDAIREDRPIPDARLEALRTVTRRMVEQRGWLEDAEVAEFLAAGFNREQLLEVVLGVGLKTLSNYTNHIAGTELDEAFAGRRWRP